MGTLFFSQCQVRQQFLHGEILETSFNIRKEYEQKSNEKKKNENKF